MLLTSHGFRDVQHMTESHAIAILNVLSGVKTKPPPAVINAEPNATGVKNTRWVSSKKSKPNKI